jgi:pullulanase
MKSIFIAVLAIFVLCTNSLSAQIDAAPNTLSKNPASDKDKMKKKGPKIKRFTNAELDKFPVYNGKDLGLTYTPTKSIFKVWSPPAAEVRLYIFDREGTPPSDFKIMKKGKNGVWVAKMNGDLAGKYYNFQVMIDSFFLAASVDPYAKAVGTNGELGQVVDLAKTNPPGWETDQKPPLASAADIVLYELHIRDVSIHPSSGIKNKGKYLGLAETGTKTPDGLASGLDHIKELGVTHVHLMPAFDFRSIDESYPNNLSYNWGYDPQNYNAPEGSFATNPGDGATRILEFKTMVKALHDNGLRVVMDVVYNHTGATQESVFNQFAPDYYYRRDAMGNYSNASACGNEVASERPMSRKFMLESMLYWAKEYHIDGFRVDLMGIHDIETMNKIMVELRKIDPSIFVYGEGWTAGSSTLPDEKRAIKANVSKLDGIAAFSDEFRDGAKGHVFTPIAKGFINGENKLEESVKFGIVGGVNHPQVNLEKVNYTKVAWAKTPLQCIKYVSCHDNHSLWDRLLLSCPQNSELERLNMNKLAQTMVFTSQGVPFLHAGEEFVRSKELVENSYQSSDKINQINWDNKAKYLDLYQYYQQLIKLRKAHPAFRMSTEAQIQEHLKFMDYNYDNVVGFTLGEHANGDSWKRILVIYNGNPRGKQLPIPPGKWKIICTNNRIDLNGMGENTSGFANVGAFAAYILAEE